MTDVPVKVTLFRWAGRWGPFKVKVPCGECSLTVDVIEDTFAHELTGIPVVLDTREWLSEWWRPLPSGGWHAPIVLVEGRMVSQGHALNRGMLTEAVIEGPYKARLRAGQPPVWQGDLSALRARQRLSRESWRRIHLSRCRARPAGALRDARPGETRHRRQDACDRAADLAGREICGRGRRPLGASAS